MTRPRDLNERFDDEIASDWLISTLDDLATKHRDTGWGRALEGDASRVARISGRYVGGDLRHDDNEIRRKRGLVNAEKWSA